MAHNDRCSQVVRSHQLAGAIPQLKVNMKNKKKEKKRSKKTTAMGSKKKSCGRLGGIKAFTVLSLSKRKLNHIDDEVELCRSVLITNTMKSVRQEMTGSCRLTEKKSHKKSRDKMVTRLKTRLDLLGTHGRGRLKILRRNVVQHFSGKKKLKRVKSKENLL